MAVSVLTIFFDKTETIDTTDTAIWKPGFNLIDMGLINEVDMVCLSPVGYGV